MSGRGPKLTFLCPCMDAPPPATDCCCPAGAGHFLLSVPTCFFGFLGSCAGRCTAMQGVHRPWLHLNLLCPTAHAIHAACPYGTYAPHGCGYSCQTCPQNTFTWNTASTSASYCLRTYCRSRVACTRQNMRRPTLTLARALAHAARLAACSSCQVGRYCANYRCDGAP